MMKIALRWTLAVLFLATSAGLATAQVTTGTPKFSVIGGGPDQINLANLNVHLAISVLHKPGRGLPFNYDITYDSSIWQPVGASGSQTWEPTNVGGFGFGFSGLGKAQMTNAVLLSYCYTQLPPPYGETVTGYVYGLYYTYFDLLGTPHAFPGEVYDYVGTCGNGSPDYSGSPGTAADGSGYTASVGSSTGNVTVTAKNGQIVNWTADSNNNLTVPYEVDTNGNEITTNSSNQFFDTLSSSTPVLTVSGTAPNPTTFTYMAPSGGGNVSYTMKFTNYTVKSNFGCAGIADYGPTAQNLVSEIDLPDGSKYTFTYEATPGYSGDVTGRIASVTLPTGGTINYSYSGGNNGIVCADGSTATMTRQTPDGTWTYSHSENGTAWTTNQTDPQGNLTVMNFQEIYSTETQKYQGSSTLLQTIYACYNGASAPCNSTSITLPITQETSFLQWANGSESETDTLYNSYGLVTEQDDYDYGSGGPGPLLRKKTTTYASLGNGIVDRPAQVTTYNGAGTAVAETLYDYDQNSLTSSGISTQHISFSGSRGNLTTVSQSLNNSWLTTGTYTYYDTGMIAVAQDAKGNPTNYNYSATCAGAYPTTVTNALNQSTTYAYDPNSGQVTSTTDPNNQTTSYTYDSLMRPLSVSYPDGGETTYSYPNANETDISQKIDGSGRLKTTVNLVDGLGRPSENELTSDPEGTDYTLTTYDSLGRVYRTYNASRCNPPTSNCGEPAWGYTTDLYDALSRIISITAQDGSITTTSYSGNSGTVTDPAGKVREFFADALGRLTEVIENPGGLNYTTDYSYDALGNFTDVVQDGSHQRTFVYDSLSRLTSEANPESGTTTYAYDANGNVTSRTDARGVTTTYSYDALNRVIQKTYSDGTPSMSYTYDADPGWWPGCCTNEVGRLVEAKSAAETSTVFSYDPMGRVAFEWEQTPPVAPSGELVDYTYNLLGEMTSLTFPNGTQLTYSYDAAGRSSQLTSSWNDSNHPATLWTPDPSQGYYPNGAVKKAALGNGLTEATLLYDRLRPCRIELNSSGSLPSGCNPTPSPGNVQLWQYVFGSWGSTDSGDLTELIAAGAQNFNRTYAYDGANRLASMSAPGDQCTGLTWTYDAWGNRTDQTATGGTCDTFHQSVNANNQFTSGYQYDADGDVTYDGVHSYTFDAENHLVTVDGGSTASYVYDAFGNRVQKTAGGVSTQYYYDFSGKLIATYDGGCGTNCWNTGYIYVHGHLAAEYSNSTTYFVQQDLTGSTRLVTGYPTPNIAECDDYYPFGELISCGGASTTAFKFAGYLRDSETNLDDANARYFASSLGRFMSPDPSGLSLQNPADPQTVNLYSYVRNNPLTNTDPTGLDSCDAPAAVGMPGCQSDDSISDGASMGGFFDSWDASMAGGSMDLTGTAGYIPGGCASCLISQQPYTGYFGTDSIQAAADAAVGVSDPWNTININTSFSLFVNPSNVLGQPGNTSGQFGSKPSGVPQPPPSPISLKGPIPIPVPLVTTSKPFSSAVHNCLREAEAAAKSPNPLDPPSLVFQTCMQNAGFWPE